MGEGVGIGLGSPSRFVYPNVDVLKIRPSLNHVCLSNFADF